MERICIVHGFLKIYCTDLPSLICLAMDNNDEHKFAFC